MRFAVVLAVLAAGCGSPRMYYETTSFEHEPLAKKDYTAVRNAAAAAFSGRTVRVAPVGKRPKKLSGKALKKQPAFVARALLALAGEEYHGAEADLLIRRKGKQPVPVSVMLDLEGHAQVVYGKPMPKPGKTPGRKKIRSRYGTGPLTESGKSKWNPPALRALQEALELLSGEERRLLVKLPFKRTSGRGKGRLGAQHEVNNCEERIWVYDRAFIGRAVRFVGRPEKPTSGPAGTLLHELGHALHSRPGRVLYCRYQKRFADLEKRRVALNRRIKKGKAKQKDVADFEKRQRDVEAMGDKALRWTKRGPVLTAYAKIIRGSLAPTVYGEESVAESFAESFSLYRADPDALKRLLPKVAKWFANKGHLKALGAARTPTAVADIGLGAPPQSTSLASSFSGLPLHMGVVPRARRLEHVLHMGERRATRMVSTFGPETSRLALGWAHSHR